jgi:3-hydroxyisobutyrate dehydrogenase-like beta-hydroxyacid dehydrogenase
MGSAMAERLLNHGQRVFVWNRSPEKASKLIARGAVWSDHPLRETDLVIVSLYSSPVVSSVIQSMWNDLHSGLVLVDTTTGEPDDAVRIARDLTACGVRYLEAPISGSSEQTRLGEATILVGGDQETYQQLDSLWKILGKKVFHIGEVGGASRMKLVTNLVLGLHRLALAEGLSFAKRIGIEGRSALEVLKQSAAYSTVMDVKGEKMLSGDFLPQARLSQHRKDVQIILDLARRVGLDLPLSALHETILRDAESLGLGDLDNSAVVRLYEETQSG